MSDNPYSAPVESPTSQRLANHSSYHYKPLNTLAKVLLISVSLVCLGNLAVSIMEVIGQILFPNFSDPNAPISSDLEQYFIFAIGGLGLLTLPAFILAAVVSAMYFYRANANLRSFGVRGLQHTPGWCAGYWFIPIVNLFKPYQVASEINAFSHLSKRMKPSSHVGVWWTCWIISNIVSRIENRLALNGVDLGTGGSSCLGYRR